MDARMSPPLKLFGVMMLRDEADIVEASVRHNLALLDGLLVIDHGSCDGTADILNNLAAEGLALAVLHDESPAFYQGERITEFARRLILEQQADFVFALDADEFLKLQSRPMLEAALREVPPGVHAVLHWLTYVPDRVPASCGAFTPASAAMRLKTERHGQHKVIIARCFASRSTECVGQGNHLVFDRLNPAELPRHARISPTVAALAHFPVRSRQQFETKVVLGHLANLAAERDKPDLAFHWRDAYEDIKSGIALDEARLRQIACNYGLRREVWQPVSAVELVADPVPFGAELRYGSSARLDTLPSVLHFVERLIAGR
jgi:hypothetical protein